MNNYKQTEIGQFPNNWGINIIEEVFQIKQGKQLSAKYRHGENEFSFLRTSNVLWGKLDLSKLDKMNFTEDEREKLALNTNDLLVCEGGEIGRTAIWKGEVCNCYYQNHIHRLRAKTDSVCEDFFMYWMMYGFLVGKLYFSLGIKTTIPNLSQSKLKAMPIPLPPLPEQLNIAFILSKIQSAIEIQEKIIKTTTELKKALMQKLFTEGLHNEPQKETEIGLVPESWEVVELGGLSENPKYGFTDSAAVKGIVKFLRITDIQENGVNWETVPFCNCQKIKYLIICLRIRTLFLQGSEQLQVKAIS